MSKRKEALSVIFITIFVVSLIGVTAYVSKNIFLSLQKSNTSYILKDLVTIDVPVVNEVEEVFTKPFNDTNVKTQINFYQKEDTSENQERSLILYDNTYMPSTGILYSSDKLFDVLAPYEGTIEDIKEDNTFGTIITIKHNNNLISKISSVKDVEVSVGDTVNAGEIICTSGLNKLTSVSENMLLFEVIKDGKYINPESLYDQNVEEMN